MPIKIIDGDLFTTKAPIICHQVNCQGVMGSGVAKQVREKFPHVFEEYKRCVESFREFIETRKCFKLEDLLGVVHFSPVKKQEWYYYRFDIGFNQNFIGYLDSEQYIANLFAQANYGYDGKMYTDLKALKNCFLKVRNMTKLKNNLYNATIAMPYKIGCCRGGADWDKDVFPMIKDVFSDCDVELWRWDKG